MTVIPSVFRRFRKISGTSKGFKDTPITNAINGGKSSSFLMLILVFPYFA